MREACPVNFVNLGGVDPWLKRVRYEGFRFDPEVFFFFRALDVALDVNNFPEFCPFPEISDMYPGKENTVWVSPAPNVDPNQELCGLHTETVRAGGRGKVWRHGALLFPTQSR